jgi:hypothetical protein
MPIRRTGCGSLLLALALAEATSASAQPATAPAKPWSVVASWDASSRYLFRGLDLLDGEPVQYGHVAATYGVVTAHWWGFDGDLATDEDSRKPYREYDFALESTFAGKSAWLTTGAVAYTFPDPEIAPDTVEVYLIGGLSTVWSPKLSIYYDVDAYEGGYASLGISRRLALPHGFALTPSASLGHSLGWTHRLADPERRHAVWDVNDALLGVDLAWSRGGLTLHAAAQESFALAAVEDVGGEDVTVVTTGVSYSF